MTSAARSGYRASDRLALVIASGAGAGYLPIAPGTWGSAIVPVVMGIAFALGVPFTGVPAAAALLGVGLALGWAGCWAGDRVSVLVKDDDPSLVVIDEVVGQVLTYSFLPLAGIAWTPAVFAAWLVVGFFLFRALDIFKPGPIDELQRAHGGVGIMADDFLAGIVGGWALLVAAMLLE